MADYKNIKGVSIQSLASDPTKNAGDVWYNTTSGKLKAYVSLTNGIWAVGTPLPNPREGGTAGGDLSAGWITGGTEPGPAAQLTSTDIWNGSTWTSGPSNTGYTNGSGGGTATSGIYGGGSNPAYNVQEWDGATWTNGGGFNTQRYGWGPAGTATAMLAACGEQASGPYLTSSELYNGTSWTTTGSTSTARYAPGALGTSTSALAFGGLSSGPSLLSSTEEFGGSSWTGGGSLSTGIMGAGGCGTQTAGLVAGGFSGSTPWPGGSGNPALQLTAFYDGSSFSSQTNGLIYGTGSSSFQAIGNAGTQANTIMFGGSNDPAAPDLFQVQEWYGPGQVGPVELS
jgi:hypothetical protein